jgi:ABC-type polysaccharide/polyol phosphate export permease
MNRPGSQERAADLRWPKRKMGWRQFVYVLYQTTRASFLSEEKNSSLGLIWHLINPILMTAVLYLVFRQTERFGESENYFLFIMIGLIHYNFFANSTKRSALYFVKSRSLVLNTRVPLELLVFRQSCIEGLTLLVEVVLVLIIGVLIGAVTGTALLLYPLVFSGLLALGAGASLILCGLVVFFSDLSYVWGLFSRLLFFLTPVFYSPLIVKSELAATVLWLNPLTPLITIAREALLYGGHVTPGAIVHALLGPLLILGLGVLVFRSTRSKIPDFI